MPLEAPPAPVSDRVHHLNLRYINHGAISVLDRALSGPLIGRIALVSIGRMHALYQSNRGKRRPARRVLARYE